MGRSRLIPAALLLAVGLAAGGWAAGQGFSRARLADRYVTVKGVAEREVDADLALWSLNFVSAGNDLPTIQGELASSVARTMVFLAGFGIDSSQVELQSLRVEDARANLYRGDNPITDRYAVNQELLVRSTDPASVLAASQAVGRLVAAGVAISSGGRFGGSGPAFLFTRLNDLKPAMLQEATARAREAAGSFAEDSGARVGGIRRANQGVFQILPRDPAPGAQEEQQLHKVVRVVSTLDYYLRD